MNLLKQKNVIIEIILIIYEASDLLDSDLKS